ncbi:Gfo/Idh/MocA family protein [Paenibacillus cremeus]|uniref:Gfo/Idh/MocA family oxidoreductase n=1 Tax=Paenibacillus cremeus TaxID=2163881 RepID=A0A559K7B4_9BACL|nr:Gfo/Idh/MocA family oxidoreductase [Paenibacillus cremeus]TVY08007.1 Gfo/Idh/MocA family oxidoreductase [Paenibacillus cremeus]
MKKKVALIGNGQVAEKVHIAYYNTREDIEIVAVVGATEENVKQFAARHNIPSFYTNAEEMYLVEKPDIISVCTPNRFHFDNVMQALKHNCDVLCEKPPAISAEDAKKMFEYAKQKGKILAYNFHHRFADDVTELKNKIDQGILGEIYFVKVTALRRNAIPGWGTFINKEAQGGGPLIDIGIHMLDAAMYVLGYPKVKKVTAKLFQKIGIKKSEGAFGSWDPKKYTVEDSLFSYIELENGGLIQLETSFALNLKLDAREKTIMNVELCGDEAGATMFPAEIYKDDKGELVSLFKREAADEDRHTKSMQAFVNRCLGGNDRLADGEEGYSIQKLVETIYQSAEKNESVEL